MKTFKKLASFFVCFAMVLAMTSMSAFAATEGTDCNGLPDDAVIIAKEDNVTFYRSESQALADGISPYTMDYAYAWVEPSDRQDGTFYISKSFWGTAHITFKVESSYGFAYAQMSLRHKDGSYIGTATTPFASENKDYVLDKTVTFGDDFQVDYLCYNNEKGMRLMCWLWN